RTASNSCYQSLSDSHVGCQNSYAHSTRTRDRTRDRDSPRSKRHRTIGKTMSDPISKPRRGNPRMRAGMPSLNPHGRPRTGESLAEAAREKVSPEQLVEKLLKLADTAASEQVRLAALLAIGDRGYGKVAHVVDAKVNQPRSE